MELAKLYVLITQMIGLVNGEMNVLVLEEEMQTAGGLEIINHFVKIQLGVLGEVV